MRQKQRNMICRLWTGLLIVAAVIPSASAVTNGAQQLANLTIPRGGMWIPDRTAAGGHFWFTDSVNGICRLDGVGASSNCNATAKSGGQISFGIGPAPSLTQYIFVPDNSTTSTHVVRFVFNPGNATLGSSLIMNIPNVTQAGGGTAGGRAVATALDSQGSLYVGYIKSGDIMKVPGAMVTTSQTPPTSRVASTSDGRGVFALLFFGNDMYVAEIGGFGLSKIQDPSGVTRVACSAAAVCSAVSLSPQISFFPGGLATDGVSIYIGDNPLTTPGSVLQWNPALPVSATNPVSYSVNVSPSYTFTFNGTTTTYNRYVGIAGVAVAPNGDVYVSDDPTTNLVVTPPAVLPTQKGHLWKVAFPGAALSVVSFTPASAPDTGGTAISLTGTGFSLTTTRVTFGTFPAQLATCASVTSCTAVTPVALGAGTVSLTVSVTSAAGVVQTVNAGLFSFTATGVTGGTAPTITSISPSLGLPAGGTVVTIVGTNLLSGTVNFGLAGAGRSTTCASATLCTSTSPAIAGAGPLTVDIQVTVAGVTSATSAADKFTYGAAVANLYSWGITAPKGGMTFIPGNLGGHMWSSDHAQGFCRQDPLTARAASPAGMPAGFGTPATPGSLTLHALNYAVCDNGTIGSSGQAVYDPFVNPSFINTTSGNTIPAGTHFIYVPDNAVKSTAVWRLTFDPVTETLVDVPEAMVPLADVRTLKPNGMALGPDGNTLYITDLVEPNIRKLTGAHGDPRLQTISIVAQTGDLRGANGTIAFAGLPGDTAPMGGVLGAPQYQNVLVISENRAAAWFDVTACPTAAGPCGTTALTLPSAVFVGGVAADAVRHIVYAADSPGGANATIWRINLATPAAIATAYLTGGQLPAAGTPEATVWLSQTAVRPWDPLYVPGGIAGFSFAFGIYVDNRNGDLYITGDPTAGARGGFGTAWLAHLVQ